MSIPITKLKDFEYQITDPKTGGKWIVVAPFALTDLGVLYTAMDIAMRDDVRPTPDGQITVHFSFKVEGNGDQKSKAQKFFEALVQQQ